MVGPRNLAVSAPEREQCLARVRLRDVETEAASPAHNEFASWPGEATAVIGSAAARGAPSTLLDRLARAAPLAGAGRALASITAHHRRTRCRAGRGLRRGSWRGGRRARPRHAPRWWGSTRPERLALGAAIGSPASASSACATGCAGALSAMVSRPALTRSAMPQAGRFFSTSDSGPGQNACARCRAVASIAA